MRFRVKAGDRAYEVEVGDVEARPVRAVVEGEVFEVWPEEQVVIQAGFQTEGQGGKGEPRPTPGPGRTPAAAPSRPAPVPAAGIAVSAPIPGVIESIAVRPGDVVEVGQTLCVLEAMKMKNVIRAPRAGEIAAVPVSAGQHVKHNDLLFEYAS